MIPINFIEKWVNQAPWQTPEMVEQDLTLSSNKAVRTKLVFQGGTALNKLYINPPAR